MVVLLPQHGVGQHLVRLLNLNEPPRRLLLARQQADVRVVAPCHTPVGSLDRLDPVDVLRLERQHLVQVLARSACRGQSCIHIWCHQIAIKQSAGAHGSEAQSSVTASSMNATLGRKRCLLKIIVKYIALISKCQSTSSLVFVCCHYPCRIKMHCFTRWRLK